MGKQQFRDGHAVTKRGRRPLRASGAMTDAERAKRYRTRKRRQKNLARPHLVAKQARRAERERALAAKIAEAEVRLEGGSGATVSSSLTRRGGLSRGTARLKIAVSVVRFRPWAPLKRLIFRIKLSLDNRQPIISSEQSCNPIATPRLHPSHVRIATAKPTKSIA